MQMQKQMRKAAREDAVKVHKVKVDLFNPIPPKGIEMISACFVPKGEVVLVSTQRRES